MTSKKRAMALSAIAMGCLGALGAQSALADQSFVLQAAGKWSDAQTKAVQAAGGTVTFSHGETGIGVATSANPNFLSAANTSRAGMAMRSLRALRSSVLSESGAACRFRESESCFNCRRSAQSCAALW